MSLLGIPKEPSYINRRNSRDISASSITDETRAKSSRFSGNNSGEHHSRGGKRNSKNSSLLGQDMLKFHTKTSFMPITENHSPSGKLYRDASAGQLNRISNKSLDYSTYTEQVEKSLNREKKELERQMRVQDNLDKVYEERTVKIRTMAHQMEKKQRKAEDRKVKYDQNMKEKLNRQKKERLDKLNNYKKNLKEDELKRERMNLDYYKTMDGGRLNNKANATHQTSKFLSQSYIEEMREEEERLRERNQMVEQKLEEMEEKMHEVVERKNDWNMAKKMQSSSLNDKSMNVFMNYHTQKEKEEEERKKALCDNYLKREAGAKLKLTSLQEKQKRIAEDNKRKQERFVVSRDRLLEIEKEKQKEFTEKVTMRTKKSNESRRSIGDSMEERKKNYVLRKNWQERNLQKSQEKYELFKLKIIKKHMNIQKNTDNINQLRSQLVTFAQRNAKEVRNKRAQTASQACDREKKRQVESFDFNPETETKRKNKKKPFDLSYFVPTTES